MIALRRTRTVASAAALALLGASPLTAQGAGGRLLSPRDTTAQTIGDARLMVDYGRPSKRGREIFGGLVPWNQVWRTGANEATHFVTNKDLVIGGTTVPAGTYTLYSLPTPSGWKLIINKQTGQWGTEYDQEQDLARIDMTVEKRSPPLEQFTITIEPRGQGGVLRLAWDTTQASVPFIAKR